MKRFLFWLIKPLLKRVIVGQSLAILDETGGTRLRSKIMSLIVVEGQAPRVVVVPEGGGASDIRIFELFSLRFNTTARRFEVENRNAVERNFGPEVPSDPSASASDRKSQPPARTQPEKSDTVEDDSPPETATVYVRDHLDVPPGTLIAVSPDQSIRIMHASGCGTGLSAGTVIWGHPHTIAWIREQASNPGLH